MESRILSVASIQLGAVVHGWSRNLPLRANLRAPSLTISPFLTGQMSMGKGLPTVFPKHGCARDRTEETNLWPCHTPRTMTLCPSESDPPVCPEPSQGGPVF